MTEESRRNAKLLYNEVCSLSKKLGCPASIYDLWTMLTEHISVSSTSTTTESIGLIAKKYAEKARKKRKPVVQKTKFVVFDIKTELYYDPKTQMFSSAIPIPVEKNRIKIKPGVSTQNSLRIPFEMLGNFDFNFVRFVDWIGEHSAFSNAKYAVSMVSQEMAEYIFRLESLQHPLPTHAFFIGKNKFNDFKRKIKESMGIVGKNIFNFPKAGMVFVYSSEIAAMISLLGYSPIDFKEIKEKLNGSKGYIKS